MCARARRATCSEMWPISVWGVRRNFCRAGTLKNSSRISTALPTGPEAAMTGSIRSAVTRISWAESEAGYREMMRNCDTAPMLGRASIFAMAALTCFSSVT